MSIGRNVPVRHKDRGFFRPEQEVNMRQLRRVSPAMIVACVALAVALGGTGYATISTVIPRESVGTMQLKDNAVTAAKVRDFSLRAWDFKRGSLPTGPAGPAGLAGPQGPPGVVGDVTMHEGSVAVPGNTGGNGLFVTRAVQVSCPSGEKVVAGGTRWSSDTDAEQLITVYSRPLITNGKVVGWRARGGSDVSGDRIFNVQVLCSK
jgi:hypothetical protein